MLRKYCRGMTLVEVVVAVSIMGFVFLLGMGLVRLTTEGVLGIGLQAEVVRQDAAFVAKVNDTIKKSGTAFTVPKASFIEEKLTRGWNYLGMMEAVEVPESASRSGKKIPSTQAFVYIESLGDTRPSVIPTDANLISTSGDGYFLQTVLGHDYADHNGVTYDYELYFYPESHESSISKMLRYEFLSEVRNAENEVLNSDFSLEVKTLLNALNAVQIVYKGSDTNPATAIAFRSDFIPTYSVESVSAEKPAATVTMVLDLSGSMKEPLGGETRLSALQKSAKRFVEELSENDNIQVGIFPFSSFGTPKLNYPRNQLPTQYVYNAYHDKAELQKLIDGLAASGGTNVGDGLRRAYCELVRYEALNGTEEQHFLILMTDGVMNSWSVSQSAPKPLTTNGFLDFYEGDLRVPPGAVVTASGYVAIGPATHYDLSNTLQHPYYPYRNYFSSEDDMLERGARNYMRKIGEKVVTKFGPKTFLINLSGGMSSHDLEALKDVFNTDEVFDVDSLTDFDNVFDIINKNIGDVMWAFEGPRL